jgi:hypothetical protein
MCERLPEQSGLEVQGAGMRRGELMSAVEGKNDRITESRACRGRAGESNPSTDCMDAPSMEFPKLLGLQTRTLQ